MSDAATKIMDSLLGHCNILDSIADLIRFSYPIDDINDCYDILKLMKIENRFFEKFRSNRKFDYDLAQRNIRNAWYHECAFVQDNSSNTEKMKFTAWKIIQFYYSVYCGLSAMIRCETLQEMGHEKMINFFTSNILKRRELELFFPQPFCFYLSQNNMIKPAFTERISWQHGLQIKCPEIEKCLREMFTGKPVSLFHYLLRLRNWVNYEDSYIFRRFYARTIKPYMYSNMMTILTSFLSLSELYLIKVLGLDVMRNEVWLFISDFRRYMEPEIERKNSVTSNVMKRFSYYNDYESILK